MREDRLTVYCATTNPGKLREFRLAAERHGRGRVAIEPVPGDPAFHETGSTFEENAVQKALHYSGRAPGLLFADDSGLAVRALDGAPGVRSARFAGSAATDATNNGLLLERLRNVEDRAAEFVCLIALAERGCLIETFRGTVAGRILNAPHGENGFGYDPLFYYPPFGCTFGEVEPERKMEVSHRGQALRALFEYLARRSPARLG